jgi:hypothetical protein
LVGARTCLPRRDSLRRRQASARFDVWMGKTPRHPMSGWHAQVEAA